MGQQTFGVDAGCYDENRIGFFCSSVDAGGQIDVVVEGAIGSFVEFLRVDGNVIGFRGIGCWFEHG
ncbi:hypothetical protein D9M71_492260 [compost metagenome]